jgi:hypothetical protein
MKSGFLASLGMTELGLLAMPESIGDARKYWKCPKEIAEDNVMRDASRRASRIERG